MATLKISDLSVGDWERVINQFNAQIDGYHSGSGSLSLKTRQGNLVYYRLEDIEPIPIPAELLEKKGWKQSKSNWFEFEDGEWKINIWIGKSKCNIEISQKREIYISTYADIQVVKSNINTLQHALRLAGVDKEINL